VNFSRVAVSGAVTTDFGLVSALTGVAFLGAAFFGAAFLGAAFLGAAFLAGFFAAAGFLVLGDFVDFAGCLAMMV
jgi:hypothetical protein